MMKTLFLQPPSFDGFDGGAGSRYQAQARDPSFWYPDLARPAGRAGARQQADRRAAGAASGSTPCCRQAARLRAVRDPHLDAVLRLRREGRRGAEGRQPGAQDRLRRRQGRGRSRRRASRRARAIDFVARNEFDFTIKEVAEGRDLGDDRRHLLSRRGRRDRPQPGPRDRSRTWTSCRSSPRSTSATCGSRTTSSATCMHPYVSLYTGPRLQIALHLLPVAADRRRPPLPGAHRPSTSPRRSGWRSSYFPQVKEFFFDDDTFTDNLPRAEAIARELGKLGVTWSCNAKANVPRETLKVLKDNGLRLLLVGYESGNQQILHNIKKGMRIEVARKLHQGLPRARHHDPRHLHPRPARRDQGDDRGDDPLRHRDQPAHDPGLAGRALSRHVPVQAGGRERLARRRACRADRRSAACRSRRCTIRICRTPRSSTSSRPSTSASTSARRRSPRSWAAIRV